MDFFFGTVLGSNPIKIPSQNVDGFLVYETRDRCFPGSIFP